MDSRRIRNLRNSFDKNIVDKQVDKIFETGRQFVDGVSGARPGKRRNSDFQGITSKSVKKVGRWVSEKVDLFFDEDNDCLLYTSPSPRDISGSRMPSSA